MERDHGFTPFQRQFQNLQKDSPATSKQVFWTTAKCNRLLRPLSSRIALLRKSNQEGHKARGRPEDIKVEESCSRRKWDVGSISPSQDMKPRQHGHGRAPRRDFDWAPSPLLRKKIKHTYSARTHNQNLKEDSSQVRRPNTLRTNILEIQIPFNGKEGHGETVGSTCSVGIEQASTKDEQFDKDGDREAFQIKRKQTRRNLVPDQDSFRRTAKHVLPAQWMLITGIYGGLHGLLTATSRNELANRSGTKSLFSTCLRKVPDYIELEQYWAKQDDPESELDVSSNIYGDLESYGASEFHGWKPLKEVVRSHGIAILGAAIKDGLLAHAIVRGIVILCLQLSAYDEAQYLIECLLTVAGSSLKSGSFNAMFFKNDFLASLGILDLYATRSGRHGFQFRCLSELLSTRILPLELLANHEFTICWNRAIRSVCQEDSCAPDASQFLRTAVSLSFTRAKTELSNQIENLRVQSYTKACGLSKANIQLTPLEGTLNSRGASQSIKLTKPLSNAISKLLTVLCSAQILRSSNSSPHGTTSLSTTLRNITSDSHIISDVARFELLTDLILLPLLANTVIEPQCKHNARVKIEDLCSTRESANLHASEMSQSLCSSFICAIARCCEQGGSKDALWYLQQCVRRLVPHSKASASVRRLAVAAALDFAEETNQTKHLDWALEIENDLLGHDVESKSRTPGRTPAKASFTSITEYRWMEGICEWVAKTPAIAVDQYRSLNSYVEDFNNISESSTSTPLSHKEPCLSEISPCRTSFQAIRRRAYQGRVSFGVDELNDSDATPDTSKFNIKSTNIISRKRRLQQIDDGDFDELSAPNLWQKGSTIRAKPLQEITNTRLGMQNRIIKKNMAQGELKLLAKHEKRNAARPKLAQFCLYGNSDDELGL